MAARSTQTRLNDIPSDVQDDLSSRFIVNIPKEEQMNMVKVMFQIELGHWFYLDFMTEENPNLPRVPFKVFTERMFAHVPFLRGHMGMVDSIIEQFREFKANVPTYGAIIVDSTHEKCLMVQGYWAKNSWGFPKGKVNHCEDPLDCAIREVKEETGYDCSHLINNQDFIEKDIRGTRVRLYIVPGVDLKEKFAPLCRNEIRNIEWFMIKDLPGANSANRGPFFMATPFLRELREWIKKRNKLLGGGGGRGGERRGNSFNLESLIATSSISSSSQLVNPMSDIGATSRITGGSERKYWTRHWDNIQLDWDTIWSQVDRELALN